MRQAIGKQFSLTKRPGYLRLYGEQSITSLHKQTLIARRWQHFNFEVETKMEFEPKNFQQMAGLTLFFDTENWHYLHVSHNEDNNVKYLQLETATINKFTYNSERIEIEPNQPINLKVEVYREWAQFYYSVGEEKNEFKKIGTKVAVDTLSSDFIKKHGKLAFTGAMVGICAQDLDDHSSFADFKYFAYSEKHL